MVCQKLLYTTVFIETNLFKPISHDPIEQILQTKANILQKLNENKTLEELTITSTSNNCVCVHVRALEQIWFTFTIPWFCSLFVCQRQRVHLFCCICSAVLSFRRIRKHKHCGLLTQSWRFMQHPPWAEQICYYSRKSGKGTNAWFNIVFSFLSLCCILSTVTFLLVATVSSHWFCCPFRGLMSRLASAPQLQKSEISTFALGVNTLP